MVAWVLPEQHFVKCHPNGPDVCLTVVGSVVQNLRSHIQGRPQNGLRFLVFRPQQFGKPKVSNFDDAVVLEDVSEFEVPVHNFGFDESLKGVEDLNKVLEGFFLGELFLGLESSHEVSFVAVLQDQVDVVDCFFNVDEPDDIVILAAAEHLNLVIEQFGKLSYLLWAVPLILSLRMHLMATS